MRPHLFPQNQLDSSSNDFETPKTSKSKKRKAEDMEDFDSSNSTFDDTPPAPGLRAMIKVDPAPIPTVTCPVLSDNVQAPRADEFLERSSYSIF